MEQQLKSLFEISGVENLSVTVDESLILVVGEQTPPKTCPRCGESHLHRRKKTHRFLRLPPVGNKRAKIQLTTQKYSCVACKHHWSPPCPFAKGKQRMSQSFVRYALELLRFGTVQDVSEHLGVGWDVVKDIHKQHLTEAYQPDDLESLEFLSIDEFSIAKRHRYMTIVMDIPTGRIVHAVEGRKKDDIAPFLKALKKKHVGCKQSA